ncbi:MAG TPA: heavy metal translocating P-type ATPase [Candidatus Paceibacterota bacterium]|nr:heavy metal translocating P-type ATPase [Candidatus Paceibacterota bacterium]
MRYLNSPTLVLPAVVAFLLAGALILGQENLYFIVIIIGLGEVFVTAYHDIRNHNWSLDYIALLAMLVAIFSNELLAGAVIALMYTGGEALETYASHRAEASLASLLARIPKVAIVKHADGSSEEVPLSKVPSGAIIIVRTGELIPLDGLLASPSAVLNGANLTGEPLPETITQGAYVKSGSINVGEALDLTVSGTLQTSTYAKIINLVKNAQNDQAPLVRLAEKANIPFTFLTLFISTGVYILTGDISRVLAVLVIATPCPLIIAAPVAFIGGLSRAAGKNIIVKTPAVLETIARVKTIFFDKTGTLTLGEPELTSITVSDGTAHESQALSLAAALEYHSIHPLARAIVTEAKKRGFTAPPAQSVTEILGSGITGTVDGHTISIAQAPKTHHREGGISLLLIRDGNPFATFHFTDVLKENAKTLIADLTKAGYAVSLLTGDRKENAEEIFAGCKLTIYAECTPEEKYRIVTEARARGEVVAMVGDGLNDAPALARADVGIVFSGTENSASIDAAAVAILGRDVVLIQELFALSHRSVRIARQSIYTGIGLSTIGMLVAAQGFIVPVAGAIMQEGIDVAVILNALRAAFKPRASYKKIPQPKSGNRNGQSLVVNR